MDVTDVYEERAVVEQNKVSEQVFRPGA